MGVKAAADKLPVDTAVISDRPLRALQAASLSERQARAIFAQSEEAVVFVLLELIERLAEQRADRRSRRPPPFRAEKPTIAGEDATSPGGMCRLLHAAAGIDSVKVAV